MTQVRPWKWLRANKRRWQWRGGRGLSGFHAQPASRDNDRSYRSPYLAQGLFAWIAGCYAYLYKYVCKYDPEASQTSPPRAYIYVSFYNWSAQNGVSDSDICTFVAFCGKWVFFLFDFHRPLNITDSKLSFSLPLSLPLSFEPVFSPSPFFLKVCLALSENGNKYTVTKAYLDVEHDW